MKPTLWRFLIMHESETFALGYAVVRLLPPAVLNQLCQVLAQGDDRALDQFLQQLPNAEFQRVIQSCLATTPHYPTLATMLGAIAYTIEQERAALSLEVVWTGPDLGALPVRLSGPVLEGLIAQSQESLWLVSYAVYNIPHIVTAIAAALDRGVNIRFIAEDADPQMPFGLAKTLGPELMARSQVYQWPHDKRPLNARGKAAALHVKCAIADQQHILITSANLTDYALRLNMELGVLIHSAPVAKQVAQQFEAMIREGLLAKIMT